MPEVHSDLKVALMNPSIYDEFLRHLAQRGMDIPASCVDRDWSLPYEPNDRLAQVFKQIYDNPRGPLDAYEKRCKRMSGAEAVGRTRGGA